MQTMIIHHQLSKYYLLLLLKSPWNVKKTWHKPERLLLGTHLSTDPKWALLGASAVQNLPLLLHHDHQKHHIENNYWDKQDENVYPLMHYESQFCSCNCLLYRHHSSDTLVYHRSSSTKRENIQSANSISGTGWFRITLNSELALVSLAVVISINWVKRHLWLTNNLDYIGVCPAFTKGILEIDYRGW